MCNSLFKEKWTIAKYRKIKLKKGQNLYLNLTGKPYKFWPEKEIRRINKQLNNAERSYQKKLLIQESLKEKDEE